MYNKFIRFECSELDNISLTALRILVIFNILLQGHCDDKEINEELKKEIQDSRVLSKDTICIYLNTLRSLGCVISRPSRNNNFKYNLISHPFKLFLKKEEVETLIELRKYVSILCEWKTAVEIDNLFNNILKHLNPYSKKLFSSTKKLFLSREITSEKFFQDIKQLEKYCRQNKTITLLYNSPESGNKNITLTAEKIAMENGAFYLWGYNEELETSMYLRLDRILGIKSINLKNNKIIPKLFKIKYKLTGNSMNSFFLSEEDAVLEKNMDEIIIESCIKNKFRFLQKILSYGSDCTVLYPQEIKNEILQKLENLVDVYNEIGTV